MPIFMWVMQGGVQMLVMGGITTSQEGETIYVVNMDSGNESLSTNPIFQSIMGPNNITNLGSYFIQDLVNQTSNNQSLLVGATINSTKYADYTRQEIDALLADSSRVDEITPLIIIPENFTPSGQILI